MAHKLQRPKRSYRAVIESLRQVWKIQTVPEDESVWQLGEPECSAFDPERIRVAVWNMCKGAGGILFEHDFRSLCYRSDLILTQEALLSRRSMRLFCETGFQSIHAASYMRRDGLRDGVMTLSRAEAIGPIKRIICKYPEPIFHTPKAALIKFFRLAGTDEKLMVVNIHATLVRLKAAAIEEMLHIVAHLPQHDGPIVLAGDFNTFTPGYLASVAQVLAQVGLRYVPIPNDPRRQTAALDQIFIRDLEPQRIIVDTTVKNSDHFPLMIDLAYRPS